METRQGESCNSVNNFTLDNVGEIALAVSDRRGELKARLALDLGGRAEFKVRRCGDGNNAGEVGEGQGTMQL